MNGNKVLESIRKIVNCTVKRNGFDKIFEKVCTLYNQFGLKGILVFFKSFAKCRNLKFVFKNCDNFNFLKKCID